MSLLAIVYKSLFIFGALFFIVVTVSYTAFKFRQKREGKTLKNPAGNYLPAVATYGYSQNPIQKNNFFSKYYYDNQYKKSSQRLRQAVMQTQNGINYSQPQRQLYTRVSNLSEDSSFSASTRKNRSKSGKNGSLKFSKTMQKRLEGFNIFEFYEEDSQEEFYRFKTKA